MIARAKKLFKLSHNKKDIADTLKVLAAIPKYDRKDVIANATKLLWDFPEASNIAFILQQIAIVDKDDRGDVIAEVAQFDLAKTTHDIGSIFTDVKEKRGIFNSKSALVDGFVEDEFRLVAPSADQARAWIYKNERPKETPSTPAAKGFEIQPWGVEPGKDFTVSIYFDSVEGHLGFGIVGSDGQSLLKPEPVITTRGLQTFTLKIPDGVTGVTPLIYSSRGPSSFEVTKPPVIKIQ